MRFVTAGRAAIRNLMAASLNYGKELHQNQKVNGLQSAGINCSILNLKHWAEGFGVK